MLNLLALYCVLLIFITYSVYGQSENNVDNEDEDLNRYFKDDTFKPALFGSSSYDPIKEVFEPLKHPKYKNESCSTAGLQDEIIHTESSTTHDHAPDHHPPEHHPPEHNPPEHHPPEHHPPEHHPPEHHPPENPPRHRYSPFFFRQSPTTAAKLVNGNLSTPIASLVKQKAHGKSQITSKNLK